MKRDVRLRSEHEVVIYEAVIAAAFCVQASSIELRGCGPIFCIRNSRLKVTLVTIYGEKDWIAERAHLCIGIGLSTNSRCSLSTQH